jgi:hypothetical protein
VKKCSSFNDDVEDGAECVTTDQGRGYTCVLDEVVSGGTDKCVEKCDIRSVPENHAVGESPGPSTCESEETKNYNCELKDGERNINGETQIAYLCLQIVSQLRCGEIENYRECVNAGVEASIRPTG